VNKQNLTEVEICILDALEIIISERTFQESFEILDLDGIIILEIPVYVKY
jgi:hypothetical protein